MVTTENIVVAVSMAEAMVPDMAVDIVPDMALDMAVAMALPAVATDHFYIEDIILPATRM